jgi:hypothetical protein
MSVYRCMCNTRCYEIDTILGHPSEEIIGLQEEAFLGARHPQFQNILGRLSWMRIGKVCYIYILVLAICVLANCCFRELATWWCFVWRISFCKIRLSSDHVYRLCFNACSFSTFTIFCFRKICFSTRGWRRAALPLGASGGG